MKFRLLFLLLATLLLILACFLPWMTGEGQNLNGFRSELGRPAVWMLVLAAARVVFAFLKGKWVMWGELLAAAAMLFAFLDNFKTAIRIEKAGVGSGLWLLLLGILLMFFLVRWQGNRQGEVK